MVRFLVGCFDFSDFLSLKTDVDISIGKLSRNAHAMFLNAFVTVLAADHGHIYRHFWFPWWPDFWSNFVMPHFAADRPAVLSTRHCHTFGLTGGSCIAPILVSYSASCARGFVSDGHLYRPNARKPWLAVYRAHAGGGKPFGFYPFGVFAQVLPYPPQSPRGVLLLFRSQPPWRTQFVFA